MSLLITLPPVIGHRGAAAYAPENTLAGFRVAAGLGVSWVEFDVQLSADKVPVVIHDHRLDRTTDAIGLVRRTPLAQLQRLDAGIWLGPGFAGERIPTLTETLAEIAALGMGVNIEIKPAKGWEIETARRVLVVAAETWPREAPPPLVSSFARVCVEVAREIVPQWPRGFLCNTLPDDWRPAAEALGCATVHCNHKRLTAARVAAIRAAGFRVLAYTVNDPAEARRLWGWGVESVFSDVPGLLLASA